MSESSAPEQALTTVRTVDSAEAIKAIADPLRVRMLQLLMMASHRTWTVKEIAAELSQPVTKLYHHIKLLEAADLISDVETRVVSGIVEHRYRANQRSLRFDSNSWDIEEDLDLGVQQISAQLDAVRDDLLDYLYGEHAEFDQLNLSRTTARLTKEEIDSVNARIEELLDEVSAKRDDPDRANLPRISIMFLLSPLGHDPA
ncbi:MAG: helix-turn-helix transcriptional regulator [Frankiaceae bacterium]|nr:helix-turn-helix transcriptional regulator [Frankiaceae bacterium]